MVKQRKAPFADITRKRSDGPSQEKAKEILRDGKVHGKVLTEKQKGFFGARAGGEPVKKK